MGGGGVAGSTAGQPERGGGGPLGFEREPLRKLIEWFAPKSGEGPTEEALSSMRLCVRRFREQRQGAALARAASKRRGIPATARRPRWWSLSALGLASGTLGQTPHCGIVTPATGLGIEAVDALRDAGVRYFEA